MIEAAHRIVKSAQCPVCFSGAGLSAESGIPTFRDPDSGGLWAKYDPMVLASPEGFARNPELVVDWYAYRRRAVGKAQPNAAHLALARNARVTLVTQNIDDLLQRAGARNVIQLHGTIAVDRCHRSCGHEEAVDLLHPPRLRDCPRCGGRLRPAVVWFGEALPPAAWAQAEQACGCCDVLLVVGTSAAVYPAAGLIGLAKSAGARIVIVNTQPSEASALADIELLGKAGEIVPKLLR